MLLKGRSPNIRFGSDQISPPGLLQSSSARENFMFNEHSKPIASRCP